MEIKNETRLTYEILTDVTLSTKKFIIVSRIIDFFTVLFFIALGSSGFLDWWVVLLLGVAVLGYFRVISPKKLKKVFKAYIGEGEARYSFLFKDDELENHESNEVTPEAHANYPYTSFTGLEFVKNYVILYISKYQLLMIDLNGFDSEEDKNAVIALLKSKVKKD